MRSLRVRGVLSALALVALGWLWGGAVASAQTVEELAQGAQLIFEGTVVRSGAANLAILAPAPDLAVVRIDRILDGPRILAEAEGTEVTVKLLRAGAPAAGARAVFFTRGWLYGETLGLLEVGHAAAEPAVAARVAAERRRAAGEEMRQHLDAAALVVAGRVVATRPSDLAVRRGGEHDPLWQEAVLAVDRVVKGAELAAGGRLVVVFPASRDRVWMQAPKPEQGWDRVWLLERAPVAGREVYTLLHPWNVMGRAELDAVAALVRRAQP